MSYRTFFLKNNPLMRVQAVLKKSVFCQASRSRVRSFSVKNTHLRLAAALAFHSTFYLYEASYPFPAMV